MSLAPAALLSARLSALRARLGAMDLTALLVTGAANIFYLSNFRGSAGALLVSPMGEALIVDARYTTAARRLCETGAALEEMTVIPVGSSYEETMCTSLRRSGIARVGIESRNMTLARYDWLEQTLGSSGLILERTSGLVEAIRLTKDQYELALLKEAGHRISGVMSEMLSRLRPGKREREVAADIDWAIRHAGFDGLAFDTIVAAGSNTALPHARPGSRVLTTGDLVLLDFGGVYNGYCVDMTRVVSLGEPDSVAVKWHEAVCESHAAALMVVKPGVKASDVDGAARAAFEDLGLGAAFVHGTGHGLGLEVHEAPRVGKPRHSADPEDVQLEAGMVFTVEPGVYLPGAGGVRLEDDLAVTDGGYELLTDVPLDLVVV